MPRRDVYIIRGEATISTAITIVQLKAGTSYGFDILSAVVSQRGTATSVQEKIAWVRKSAAATVTAASVGSTGLANGVFLTDPGGPNPNLSLGTSATGFTATAEGTDADVPVQLGFNVLNGWYEMPVPEARLSCRVSDIIGLKFFTAPASQDWNYEIRIMEL